MKKVTAARKNLNNWRSTLDKTKHGEKKSLVDFEFKGRTYRGERDDGLAMVFFGDERLRPRRSLMVIKHDPDGFEWGYGGSGPAQLALALLLEHVPEHIVRMHYQEFKFKHVSFWKDGWEFSEVEIFYWIEKNHKELIDKRIC
jgi:hypothetical protein